MLHAILCLQLNHHQNVKETALALKKNCKPKDRFLWKACYFKYESEYSLKETETGSFWWAKAAQLHWGTVQESWWELLFMEYTQKVWERGKHCLFVAAS